MVQISREPHRESLRASLGSESATSGQNRPRAAALQAGFLGNRGCSANPLAATSTQRMIRFTTPFSVETAGSTRAFHPERDYGKAMLVLSPLLHWGRAAP